MDELIVRRPLGFLKETKPNVIMVVVRVLVCVFMDYGYHKVLVCVSVCASHVMPVDLFQHAEEVADAGSQAI